MKKIFLLLVSIVSIISCKEELKTCEETYHFPEVALSNEMIDSNPYQSIERLIFTNRDQDTIVFSKSDFTTVIEEKQETRFCPLSTDSMEIQIFYDREKSKVEFLSSRDEKLEILFLAGLDGFVPGDVDPSDHKKELEILQIHYYQNASSSFSNSYHTVATQKGNDGIVHSVFDALFSSYELEGVVFENVISLNTIFLGINEDQTLLYRQDTGVQNFYDGKQKMWYLIGVE